MGICIRLQDGRSVESVKICLPVLVFLLPNLSRNPTLMSMFSILHLGTPESKSYDTYVTNAKALFPGYSCKSHAIYYVCDILVSLMIKF